VAARRAGVADAQAAAAVEAIAAAGSPEEAARIGRLFERARPDLLRPDWAAAKLPVMAAALRAKARARSARPALRVICCNASKENGQWSTGACLKLLMRAHMRAHMSRGACAMRA